jgi:hypothetical protein
VPIAGFAADQQVAGACQDLLQPVAHDRVVVRDQESSPSARFFGF